MGGVVLSFYRVRPAYVMCNNTVDYIKSQSFALEGLTAMKYSTVYGLQYFATSILRTGQTTAEKWKTEVAVTGKEDKKVLKAQVDQDMG